MKGRHPGRICASSGATLNGANRSFQRGHRGVAVTRIDVAGLFTGEDLVDLRHRIVGVSRARIDRRRSRLTFGRPGSLAGVNQLRCDIQLFSPSRHPFTLAVFQSAQKRSLRYRSPPSQRIVTTTECGGSLCANASAANTFAPELTPTNKPSSRASRRAIAWACSVTTSTFSSASVGSKMPGMREVGKCFNPSRPWIGEFGSIEIARTAGLYPFNLRETPTNVPHVPSPLRKWVTRPSVWAQISRPVPSKCARQLASLLY